MHVHYRRTCLMINDYKNIYYMFLIDPGKQAMGDIRHIFRMIVKPFYTKYLVTSNSFYVIDPVPIEMENRRCGTWEIRAPEY